MESRSTLLERITNWLSLVIYTMGDYCDEYIITTFVVLQSYIFNPPVEDNNIFKITLRAFLIVLFIVSFSLITYGVSYFTYKREYIAKTGKKNPELSGKYKSYYDMYINSLMWGGIALGIALLSYFIHYMKMDYISIPYISNSSIRLIGLGGISASILAVISLYNSFKFVDIKRNMI